MFTVHGNEGQCPQLRIPMGGYDTTTKGAIDCLALSPRHLLSGVHVRMLPRTHCYKIEYISSSRSKGQGRPKGTEIIFVGGGRYVTSIELRALPLFPRKAFRATLYAYAQC